MWRRFSETVLWVICGIVLWHCAHSITLIFPLPGPWLPTEVAWVTGVIMGFLGCILSGKTLGRISRSGRRLFCIIGVVSGAYLGWISARGALAQQGDVLLPRIKAHPESEALTPLWRRPRDLAPVQKRNAASQRRASTGQTNKSQGQTVRRKAGQPSRDCVPAGTPRQRPSLAQSDWSQ